MKKIQVYFDGAAWLWKKCGYGLIIKQGDTWLHSEYGRVPVDEAQSTCNVAEHYALNRALVWLLKNGYENEETVVYGDSKLVISQMFRGWQCRDQKLPYAFLFRDNKALVPVFSNISGKLLPREKNKQADELSKLGIEQS